MENDMRIEIFDVGKIKPYQNNAKEHPQEQIEQIKDSIKEFGFNDPIAIDENNIVIEGHGRLIAIKELGYKEVPVIKLKHLNEKQKKAYIIAHNKLTLNTEFDMEVLSKEFEYLKENSENLENTGFSLEEIDEIINDYDEQEAYEDDFDIEEHKPENPITKKGDRWLLGEHILYCGDSTKEKDILKLTDGEIMDLVVTDPPYNVNYGKKAEAINKYGYAFTDRKIMNDYMPEVQFIAFLDDAFKNLNKVLKQGGAYYIFHASITNMEFEQALRLNEMKSRQQLIWVKNALVLGRQDYQWMHEPCLYGWKEGAGHYFVNDRKQTTVIENEEIDLQKLTKKELVSILESIKDEQETTVIRENKPTRSLEHPTMKPIKLIGKLIKNSSLRGQKVIDLFMGSGSALIACEQLGRKSYGIELDPQYVDVAVKRYIEQVGSTSNVYLERDGKAIPYNEIKGVE